MNKPKVPSTKVPIIGEKEKSAQSEEFVRQVMQYLDPIMQNILQSIDGIERRLAVVEEVKQVFPAKVDVTIKHDYIHGRMQNAGKPEEGNTMLADEEYFERKVKHMSTENVTQEAIDRVVKK